MQALDLNSQVEDFPDINSYSEILRGDGVPGGRGSRTLGLRVPRNGGRGGGIRGGSGRGGGGRSTRSLFGGSVPEGGAGSGGCGVGRGGSMAKGGSGGVGRAGGGGGRRGTTSVGDVEGLGEENFFDLDEGNDDEAVEVIFPGSKAKQGKTECKKLKYGPPEYLDQLEEMFHDVVVDGSTSFMPGAEEEEEEGAEDGEEEDVDQDGSFYDFDHSPMSTNSRKRSSSTSTRSTATSPGKKSKSTMVKMMSTLVAKWSASEDATNSIFKNVGKSLTNSINEKSQKPSKMQEMAQSVKKCQQLALECGATPDTIEFYAGRHLFKDPYEREFFCNIPTPEGRLIHSKRYCKENNLV
ncbi:hypothetical protein SETIT_3G031900v2 [Setaria italica]|uniref:Uncharacterized protein n=1 Tax=Setaria italica TaxID=4555 RepID=A0A368QAT6_SETIT|nr:hypothetical protein SETIT_3G031900v2 [Setaria italica]